MVGTWILSNNMRSPSPECYTTFWIMAIYSGTLHWSGITPIVDPITDLDLITEFDLLPNNIINLITRGFQGTFATGACQQRTLTPPDTWSCPTFGLARVLMLRPISPELVTDFRTFEFRTSLGTSVFALFTVSYTSTFINIQEVSCKLIRIELTIWSICAFLELNPIQWSLSKQCIMEIWFPNNTVTSRSQKKLCKKQERKYNFNQFKGIPHVSCFTIKILGKNS